MSSSTPKIMKFPSIRNNEERPFIEHLNELRTRAIISLILFTVFFCLSYFSAPFFIDSVKNAASTYEIELNVFKITESVSIYIKTMLIQATALTLPIILIQVFLFVIPALSPRSKILLTFTLPIVSILFSLGIFLGMYFFVPLLTAFFINTSFILEMNTVFSFIDFFNFVFTICIIFGVILELPALIVFLTVFNIITPQMLKKSRRVIYPIIALFSVTVTPPDFVSDFIVMILMFVLFELSILVSIIIDIKRKHKTS